MFAKFSKSICKKYKPGYAFLADRDRRSIHQYTGKMVLRGEAPQQSLPWREREYADRVPLEEISHLLTKRDKVR